MTDTQSKFMAHVINKTLKVINDDKFIKEVDSMNFNPEEWQMQILLEAGKVAAEEASRIKGFDSYVEITPMQLIGEK